ncbi:MAG: P1 family peptidase [Pseudomonadota bacterium]
MIQAEAGNRLTDIPGLKVGQAQDNHLKTGVTVVVGEAPMSAGISVLGGAPGTRDTQLLRQGNSIERVDAICLSGGSAFGLDASGGVLTALADMGRGIDVRGHKVPIVPGAIIFDLASGGAPRHGFAAHRDLAHQATHNASADFELGSVGAGTGALAGWLKGGVGTASSVIDGVTISALIVVNAVGAATIGDGAHFWAAPFEKAAEFGGLGIPQPWPTDATDLRIKFDDGGVEGMNTTIGVIATDAALTASQCERLAMAAQDGLARAIWPCHTPADGDCIFSLATGNGPHADPKAFFRLCTEASAVAARAVASGVFHAINLHDDPYPSWQSRFGDKS